MTFRWRWEREEDSAPPKSRCQKDGRSLISVFGSFSLSLLGRLSDLNPIHPSACKGSSANFACRGFSEVRRYEERRDVAREEGRDVVPALGVSF
jgi:hypothetical protein